MRLQFDHNISPSQIAHAMRNFSVSGAKGFGEMLMEALLNHWHEDVLRSFLAGLEDRLAAAIHARQLERNAIKEGRDNG